MTIDVQGEFLRLFAERAIYWPRENTLVITDPHFGKAATFRNSGIPVPEATTRADLARLSILLQQTGATKLLILGDLLHARAGRKSEVIDAVTAWREVWSHLEIHLIRGNHDQAAGSPPEDWQIVTHSEMLDLQPFIFVHAPPAQELYAYTMCGHIHPAVALSDGLHRKIRLPCFSFGEWLAILPAFGSFTGTCELKPSSSDRIFVIAESEVIEVSAARNGQS